MARQGKFGRLPRTAPDITSAIIALAREFDAHTESNYVDAWNNGGEVDGVKVTDEVLLAFYRKRLTNLSEKDPKYDETKNTLQQYEFAILNSKMELSYAEGKTTDAGMAAFYRREAAKLPQDSEAWRNLMTLAAQYAERARNAAGRGGGGGGGGSSSAGYDNSVQRIKNNKELGYDTILDFWTEQAKAWGILDKENEDLLDLRADDGDYSRFQNMVTAIAEDPSYKPIRDQLTDYIRQWGDPNFNGDFSWDGFLTLQQRKQEGVQARYNLAVNNGKRGDATQAMKDGQEVGELGGRMQLVDPMVEYEGARDRANAVFEDPDADVIDKWNASQQYLQTLQSIYGDMEQNPGSRTLVGHLYNEIVALTSGEVVGPTLWDDSTGQSISSGDAAETAASKQVLMDQLNLLGGADANGNLGFMVYVAPNGDIIEPSPNAGGSWQVVPRDALAGASQISFLPLGSTENGTMGVPPAITTYNADGSTTIQRMPNAQYAMVGTAIVAQSAQTDASGRPVADIAPGANQRRDVAYSFVMPDGTTLYKYWDSAGNARWSNSTDLFVEGLVPQRAPDGSYFINVPGQTAGWDVSNVLSVSFLDPTLAEAQPLTIARSSAVAWLMSGSASEQEGRRRVGVANANSLARAILSEYGGDYVGAELALGEASTLRANYLNETPAAQTQLQMAFARGLAPALPVTPGASGQTAAGALREAGGEGAAMRRIIQMYRVGENIPGFNGSYWDLRDRNSSKPDNWASPETQFRDRAFRILNVQGANDISFKPIGDMTLTELQRQIQAETGQYVPIPGAKQPTALHQAPGQTYNPPYTPPVAPTPVPTPPPNTAPAGQIPSPIPTAPGIKPNIPAEDFQPVAPPPPPPPPSGGLPPSASKPV